jgi:hypothetical protein
MSDEKKAYVSAGYSAETKHVGPSEGGTSPAPTATGEDPDFPLDGERPQGQGVLPGILGKQLRAAYGELLNNPVPDRFNDLLKKLQQSEANAAKSSRDREESK